MNDERLEEGPTLVQALRNVEANESYAFDEAGRDEMVMEERADVNMDATAPERYSVRNIHIRPLHHGYIVKLDCHEFAFETSEKAMKYIGEYLKDPHGTEEKWWKKELFK